MIKSGQWVEIRSREEILQTLDERGRLDGMPFMPQMFKYCGQRFKVFKNAYKTCDTVSGRYIGLEVKDAVHLDHRCDGEAYGGCEAGCLIFWKEGWLKQVPGANSSENPGGGEKDLTRTASENANSCTYEDVLASLSVNEGRETVYKCQATTLLDYTMPLKWWSASQYFKAYSSGNRSLTEILRGLTYTLYSYGTFAHHPRFGALQRWLYDRARWIWGGIPFPRRRGLLPAGQKAPRADLNLRPGEFVRVRPYEDILKTLDQNYTNRGMKFDAELMPYCGKAYRVKRRVERFVDESTGKMKTLKTPAVILDGVVCKSNYSGKRIFCPREIYGWWREVWLERVEP